MIYFTFRHVIMPSSEVTAGHNPSRISIDNGTYVQNTKKFSTVQDESTKNTSRANRNYNFVFFLMNVLNSFQIGLMGFGFLRFIRFPSSNAFMYRASFIKRLPVLLSLSKYDTSSQFISWFGQALIASLCPRSLHC